MHLFKNMTNLIITAFVQVLHSCYIKEGLKENISCFLCVGGEGEVGKTEGIRGQDLWRAKSLIEII